MDILDGCMAGDTLEAMANAVGRAAVVLILVTYKYKESANCRREASYANDLKKNIIPVILEPDYVPNATWGWLGLVIAGKKAFNYCRSNPKRDEELQQLISVGRPLLSLSPLSHSPAPHPPLVFMRHDSLRLPLCALALPPTHPTVVSSSPSPSLRSPASRLPSLARKAATLPFFYADIFAGMPMLKSYIC